MLTLNSRLNGFTITAIVSQFRAGDQDGAIILGMRDTELVVAEIRQEQIDSPEPPASWSSGHYFTPGPDDTDLNSQAAIQAGNEFIRRANLTAFAV